jgi:hypothetical protein
MQELAYASYLNVSVAILPPPRNRTHVPSYARAIHTCLDKITIMHFSVRVPVYNPAAFQLVSPTPQPALPSPSISASSVASGVSASSSKSAGFLHMMEEEFNTTWEMWDVIRTICESNPQLSLSEFFVWNSKGGIANKRCHITFSRPHPLLSAFEKKQNTRGFLVFFSNCLCTSSSLSRVTPPLARGEDHQGSCRR